MNCSNFRNRPINYNSKSKKELIFSMNILGWRVVGNALEVDVLKMAPEYKDFDNPFLALQKELEILFQDFKKIILCSQF
jgi:site-specific recombinase